MHFVPLGPHVVDMQITPTFARGLGTVTPPEPHYSGHEYTGRYCGSHSSFTVKLLLRRTEFISGEIESYPCLWRNVLSLKKKASVRN